VVTLGGDGAWAQLRAVNTRHPRHGARRPRTSGPIGTIPVAGLTALHVLRRLGSVLGRRVLVTGASGEWPVRGAAGRAPAGRTSSPSPVTDAGRRVARARAHQVVGDPVRWTGRCSGLDNLGARSWSPGSPRWAPAGN